MLKQAIAKRLKFGGIRPPAFKTASLRSRIMPVPLPDQLILSLQQHQGTPSRPCVKPGDRVLKFQLLASAEDHAGLNLHAPTSGRITAIDNHAADAQPCLQLQCDGEDEAISLEPVADYQSLSPQQIVGRIEAAGICGMGGAGFPTAQKLRASLDYEINYLLINAAECEPYISCDEALIRERAARVVLGCNILRRASGAHSAVIVTEANKKDAIAALVSALGDGDTQLQLVAPSYPSGDERQLVHSVMGVEISRDNFPFEAGVLVFNAATAAAVSDAVIEGQPCVSRITTLSGAPLRTPKNFETLIGTPISHLLTLCGIDAQLHEGTIAGGSLMGQYLLDGEQVVSKTSHCIIATSRLEFPAPGPELPCIRCGYCAEVCPAHLLPQQLLATTRGNALELAEQHGLMDCIECGACAYVCPSKIPLVNYYREGKQAVIARNQQAQRSAHWQNRFQYWQYRRKRNQDQQQEKADPVPQADASLEPTFSREQARAEIAAAVARVKKRRGSGNAGDA